MTAGRHPRLTSQLARPWEQPRPSARPRRPCRPSIAPHLWAGPRSHPAPEAAAEGRVRRAPASPTSAQADVHGAPVPGQAPVRWVWGTGPPLRSVGKDPRWDVQTCQPAADPLVAEAGPQPGLTSSWPQAPPRPACLPVFWKEACRLKRTWETHAASAPAVLGGWGCPWVSAPVVRVGSRMAGARRPTPHTPGGPREGSARSGRGGGASGCRRCRQAGSRVCV